MENILVKTLNLEILDHLDYCHCPGFELGYSIEMSVVVFLLAMDKDQVSAGLLDILIEV